MVTARTGQGSLSSHRAHRELIWSAAYNTYMWNVYCRRVENMFILIQLTKEKLKIVEVITNK